MVAYDPCGYCGTTRHAGSKVFCLNDHSEYCDWVQDRMTNMVIVHKCNCQGPEFPSETKNVMPEGQGKRTVRRLRHDLIPLEFLDQLAEIFEEGEKKGYGDSWKAGGQDFLTDCLNHASNHLHKYMNGDKSENQLAKVAWNCLAVRWHEIKREK